MRLWFPHERKHIVRTNNRQKKRIRICLNYSILNIPKCVCVCNLRVCALFFSFCYSTYSEAKLILILMNAQNILWFLFFIGFFMDQYSVHKFADLSRFIHNLSDHLSYLAEFLSRNAKHAWINWININLYTFYFITKIKMTSLAPKNQKSRFTPVKTYTNNNNFW